MKNEHLAELTDIISEALNAGECQRIRFVLTVWCDCGDEPMYSACNDGNIPRVMAMMQNVLDCLKARPMQDDDEVAGHA